MCQLERRRGQAARRLTLLILVVGLGCDANAGAPSSTVVGVDVSPARSLRQGQAGATIALTRASGGLSGATGFALGDLTIAKDAASTDVRLVLHVAVPHGAPPGPRTLTLIGAVDLASLPDVVDVGPIAVAPSGTDAAPGTVSAPFRTLKQALQVAGQNDTVQLAAGTYDATSGETWAYELPAGLTLAGQSQATTTLRGTSADAASPIAASGLFARGALALRALTVDGFKLDLEVAGPGDLTIADATIRHAGDMGLAIQVDESARGSRASLTNVTVEGDIMVFDTAATMAVSGSTFRNGTTGIDFSGTTLGVADSTFTDFAHFGINFAGSTLQLSGVTFEGGNYGVYHISGNAKVRRTHVRDYKFVGYYLAQGSLDLGTQTEAGDNEFSSTGDGTLGLYVDDVDQPVTCSNTTFNGDLPAAGERAAGDQAITVPGEYLIHDGKTMWFWVL